MKTNELKCTDLRIGNLLKFNDEIVIVYELYDDSISILEDSFVKVYHIDNFDPIELTEELLLKIGFRVDCISINITLYKYEFMLLNGKVSMEYFLYTNGNSILDCKFFNNCDSFNNCNSIFKNNIKFLHQLQNAYYCLTGQELNIELWKE